MKAVNLERNFNNSHSWWWDSHAGPRHSKWLKENMADMDLKVKGMLKLIEEDADSFAKRAEMYYKKRPELVSLVEEFYRAYRALAERYDHLTGELHHVQLSMGDAFPNHLRSELDSNFPRGPFLNKHSQGHVGKEHEGFGAVMEDTCHEYLDSKIIPCASASSKEMRNNGSNKINFLQTERSNAHQEKETLNRVCETRIEDEQLQKMQEQLQRVQEERQKLIQDSSSYMLQINELQDQVSLLKRENNEYVEEAKVVSLKLQSETEEKNNLIIEVQNLEAKLYESDRLNIETQVENDCSSSDQKDCRNRLVNIEDELVKLHRENHNLRTQVISGVQQSQKVNEEIQKLRQALIKSQAENDTMISQYQQSLKLYESAENRAKDLQIKMAFLQEENRRIRDEIAGAVLHMEREKNAFQQNVWHRIQIADFLQAARAKQDEEENRGKGTLDEASQILNFDTIVKNFQQSLSQSQEQQNQLLVELQAGNERVKNADSRIRLLEEDIHNLRRENNNLLEKSLSAVMSIKNLEEEGYKLKQEKNNLVDEVAFRVDQRDALQQELYCLREDRNDIDRKFQMIMKHIESLGIDAASIDLISANFQRTRQKLREHEQIYEDENLNILEVLQKMEELLNKTVILENSTASHRIEVDKLESEVSLLHQHVQSLEKEKGEIIDEHKQWSDHIRELEAKLENVHNLYSTLQRESQQHEDELANALERTKHLDEQIFSLQEEKEALVNDIVERTLQISYLQKQVDLLKGQAEVLANNLEEEITKKQMLQAEVKKLQHIIYEIDNRNQTLSDDYYRLNEKYGATEEKMMEQEETNLKQQTEYDTLLCNFSRAIDFNRELELEIKNLQKLLGIPGNVEREFSNADPEGTKGLRSIAGEVKNMQNKLSQLQEENKKLLCDAVTINRHLEQLQKDKSALCVENESTKDAAAFQLEKLMSLEKEKSQLQEQVELLKTKLEAGMETERSLQSEIDSLQESLTSSVCAHLALEVEHQRILDEQNSIKKCRKESESKLLETEEENETLLIEALSQVSLIGILESQIVEKGENMQVMEKQLKFLQGKIAKLEYWLQTCGSNPQMQETESWQLQQWICGFQDQGIKYETINKTDKELQQEISILTEESSQLKRHMQVKYEDNTDDSLHDLEGEKKQEHLQISCRSIQNEELQSIPKEVQEQGKYGEMGLHSQELGVQGERLHESPLSAQSEKTNSAGEHGSHGSEARSKVQNLKSQIAELQIRVRDLEQENKKLKCQIRNNLAGASSMGRGCIQFEERNSKLVLVEGPLNDQEKKQDLLDEVKGGMSTEDKISCGIYCFQEQNQKFWTRYDSANLQLNKLQITFQELQEKFFKTRHDNQKAKAGGQTGKQTNVIEKEFRELQDEILLWLECNNIMMKEVQHRFASVNRLQAEVTAMKGEHKEDPSEETVIGLSQAAKLQKEILNIHEENNKIANVLRAGSDQARKLEFEVEKIVLRFQGETKSTNWHKKADYPRRTSLRTFLFGKEEQRQKRKGSFGCMHPVINE